MPDAAPDRVFTLDEVRERLRISRWSLRQLIRRAPHYAKNGSVFLFSESDIAALWEVMREPARREQERLGTSSASMSSIGRVSRLHELTTKKPRSGKR